MENRIIRDLRVLTEEFIPSRILHRDSQLSALKANLSPFLSGSKARHSFLYGPPGVGKTSLSLYMAEELKKQVPILFSYINCWEASTRFSILYSVLQKFGIFVHRKGIPTDELVDLFRKKTEGKQCLIILDEVDRLEEDEILYDMLESGMGLIMISNSESALYQVDPRIRSRLSSTENIQFARYTIKEVSDILKDRREWGLVPGVLSNSIIEKISSTAGGDARVALGILSLASQKAEEKDLKKIPLPLVDESFSPALNDSRRRTMENLNPHQQFILDILEGRKMKAGELFSELQKKSKEKIVDRTFRKYIDKLVRHGLVKADGDGRWRVYSLKSF